MLIKDVKRGYMIVVQDRPVRVRTVEWVDSRSVRLHFDGGYITRKATAEVSTRAEITAGPVQSQPYARTPHRARYSDGSWRGDRAGTTQERIISYSRGWDL